MKNLFILMCCIFLNTHMFAQLNCEAGGSVFCQAPQTLNVYPGEDITSKLRNAINSGCEVRIPNNGQLSVTYFLHPMVFSGDNATANTSVFNTRIILEQGVILQSYFGATSNCSQSIFTFDGPANQFIEIIGEYTTCDKRPIIRMPSVTYSQDATSGFLVASDDVGEPYLNNAGDPNFVYDDGDSDPYFDNAGNPNLITPQNNFPQVPADCDYNFNLCNQKIIVWCPDNWEGNHIIAVHGAQHMTVKGLSLESAAGGDGIVLAGAEDDTPASEILIEDVHFINNARTGIDVVNATCVEIRNTYVTMTGTQTGLAPYVDVRGGVAFQANPNGNEKDYFMHRVEFLNSTVLDNKVSGVTLDFPSLLDGTYTPALDLKVDNICISGTNIGLLLNNSPEDLEGLVQLNNISFNSASLGWQVSSNWLSQFTAVNVFNLDLSSGTLGQDVVVGNPAVFCSNLSGSDVCLGTSTSICGQLLGCNNGNNNVCATTPVECNDPGCDNPVIALTNDGPLDCDNPFVTISTNSSGYCYTWSHDPDLTDPTIQVFAPGMYCVTATDCVTGCVTTDCTTVADAGCGDCGDKGCTCELTITLEDLAVPFDGVSFGGTGIGPIEYFDEPGTYSVTVDATDDCGPITYGLFLAGNATGVEVLATISGCGIDEQVILNAQTGNALQLFDVNLPCLPPPPDPVCVGQGSSMTWDPVPGATGYIITVIETNCDAVCSPILPDPTPIIINVAGGANTTYVATSPPLPTCYTWAVQTVGSNGAISDCSESVCQNPDIVCEDPCFDPSACPEPCPDLHRPEPGCDSNEGDAIVTWPVVPTAGGYIVTLTYGPGECCPETTASATFVYQVTDNYLTLPEGYGDCFTISVEAYCDDLTTSGPSETICFSGGQCDKESGESDGGGKRSDEGFYEITSGKTNFEVYPNPTRDILNIQFDAKAAEPLSLNVISSDGRLLKSKSVELLAGRNLLQLETDDLSSGIYFLVMESDQEKFYQKISIID